MTVSYHALETQTSKRHSDIHLMIYTCVMCQSAFCEDRMMESYTLCLYVQLYLNNIFLEPESPGAI